jgi:predicted SnoaL-like aldol condensation-catalyzing enzyme
MESSLEVNKALVRRYYEIATSSVTGFGEVVSDSFVDHHFPPNLPPGPEGVRQFFTSVLGGVFGDMEIEISQLIAEGDTVICEFCLRAKHVAEFAGIPAKGNEILCPAYSKFRVENGKLAEAWELADIAGLLEQMKK